MGEAILLYDGDCGFCSRSVRFAYARDPHARLRYCALQSEKGRALLREHGLPEDTRDTMVLLDADGAHTRSTGALRAARLLRAPWPLLARLGLLVPRPLRDATYDAVARNRHRLLHARACPAPEPGLRQRMLD
jgi:predicted DCC family thiol-disulfide oxidoreductase YuxK